MNIGTVAAVLAPALLIFVFPMVSLIARNTEYFGGAYLSGRSVYLMGMVTAVVGVGLWAVSGTRAGRVGFTAYVLLTPAWIVYSILDSTRQAGGVLLLLALVGGVAAYLTWRPRPLFFARLGLFAAIVASATGVGTFLEARATEEENVDIADRSSEGAGPLPNVYHVVLDEFQTEMFVAVLDDDLRASLGGFTWFPNAQTTWGRTQMSMAATLAHDDWDRETPAHEYVEDALFGPTSSLRALGELGYETSAYYHYSSLYYGEPHPFDNRYLAPDAEGGRPRGEHSQLARSLWLYSQVPSVLSERLMPASHFEQLQGRTLLPDDAAALSVENFQDFIDREEGLSDTGRYELVHLILPHAPYVMSPYCEFETGIETEPVEQTECAMLLMEEMIDRLESLDRFEDSVVVIHGDHGASFELTADGQLRSVGTKILSEEWSRARARPLLLVKPAGIGAEGELVESDYPALLADIMPTVFDSVGADVDPGEGRVSLLGDDLPPRDERLYHFFTPGPHGLPEGEVHRYIISGDGVVMVDETLSVP